MSARVVISGGHRPRRLLFAGGAHGAVDVTVEPPTVAYVEFDPREPPSGMPRDAGGGAWCHSVFEIDARVAASIEMLTRDRSIAEHYYGNAAKAARAAIAEDL